MAFCTKCGAAVAGAFCNQCGTPTNQSSGQATPPPPPRRGTHPLVWVLVIILGLFGLGLVGTIGFAVYVARNPARAVRRLITAANPNIEVVSTDDGAGTITLRDRRNGKIFTMSFDQARQGKFHITADDGDGHTGEFQVGGEVRLPTWLPAYPGTHPRGLFSATGDSGTEAGDAGSVAFTTGDPGSNILEFYEAKARELGMAVRISARHGGSGTIVAKDEDRNRGFKVVVIEKRGEASVTLTYGRAL
jgi:hypothetical protein